MIQIRPIGSLTEIYVGGGNSWLTENFPTNFHTFCKRKVLTGGDSAENYREVTDAEKAAIEKADEKWERPPQWVIDIFNADPNGRYNEDTGYGELHGITDLSPQEMLNIALWGNKITGNSDFATWYNKAPLIRTNLTPLNCAHVSYINNYGYLFQGQLKLEVACFSCYDNNNGTEVNFLAAVGILASAYNMFKLCGSLKKVIGRINLTTIDKSDILDSMFIGCHELQEVRLYYVKASIALADCPKLSLDSIAYMVENAKNTSPITITLHPEAYARLTDELLAKAADKNITFATTD